MPRFVPVVDSETPLSERQKHNPEYDKHRQFDAPHSLQNNKSNKKVVDRGWQQGNVGWGVLGSFGSSSKDDAAQVISKSGGTGSKMVRNEKGLWVKAKEVDEVADFRSTGAGRGGGVPVLSSTIASLGRGGGKPVIAPGLGDTTTDTSHLWKSATAAVNNQFDDSISNTNKEERCDPRDPGRRSDRDERRREYRDERRPNSRSRSRDRRDRYQKTDRHTDRNRDGRRDDNRGDDSKRDYRRDDTHRDKRRRNDSRERDSDRMNYSNNSYSKEHHKSKGYRRTDKQVREVHRADDRPMGDRGGRVNYSRDGDSVEKTHKESRDNNIGGEYGECVDEGSDSDEHAADEDKEEETLAIPFYITSIQVVNRLHEVFAKQTIFYSERVDAIAELFTEDAVIGSMKNESNVYLRGREAIKQSFLKTSAAVPTISKRVFVDASADDSAVTTSVAKGTSTEESPSAVVTFCLDMHRAGTAPGLGDKTKDTLLLYRCKDAHITTIWGMVDVEHLSSNTELTDAQLYTSNAWPQICKLIQRDMSTFSVLKDGHAIYHNYDHMEVWG